MTQVTLKQDGKTLTALLSGEIDHHWAAILREKIDERAAAAAPAILILDFSAVTFMDSSGIGLILGRHKLVSAMGGVVVDGGLIGGAALKPEQFVDIINAANQE